jgi:hypothetical protein
VLSIYSDADAVMCWTCQEIEAIRRPPARQSQAQTKWAGPRRAYKPRRAKPRLEIPEDAAAQWRAYREPREIG